jgi:hypothetical protein
LDGTIEKLLDGKARQGQHGLIRRNRRAQHFLAAFRARFFACLAGMFLRLEFFLR